jgi:acyl CoA:acetate/3-ketoacid CoA transferase beta subunit
MEHNAKDGGAKLVRQCTLPLTGVGVVDMVITELGVFTVENGSLTLTETATGVTAEEIGKRTEAAFITAIR